MLVLNWAVALKEWNEDYCDRAHAFHYCFCCYIEITIVIANSVAVTKFCTIFQVFQYPNSL